MNIQELGSLGELIAAVATIFMLGYLAVQVREHTKAVRSESTRSIRSVSAGHSRLIAGDSKVAELFIKGLGDPKSLDPVETTRFIFLISEYYALIECAYWEWKLGVGSEPEVQRLITQTSRIFQTPGGRFWWKVQSAIMPLEIKEYLDPIIFGDES